MKLSDFGFVKKISPQGTFTQSGLKGTEKWMAPEILKLMEDDEITEYPRGSIQSDTFAAGCVFFYFLTRGKHPFGKSFQIGGNILKNKPIELNKHNQSKYFIKYLHHYIYKICSTFFWSQICKAMIVPYTN
jgi:serine/threonine protein kinase